MSLFGRLFGQTQKSLNTSIFSFFSNASIPHMREGEYLKAYKGWTYACVNAIAEAFAEIELNLQTKTKDGWTNVDEHPALDLLHKVNSFQSFLDLTYATQAFLELDGNAFWYLPRNGTGAPSEIWQLDPTRMQVVKSQKDYIAGYVYTTETNVKVPLEIFEVIHFKRFNPTDKFRGVGTVQAAAIPIDIDTFAAEWQRNFFGNSAMPAGILSSEGTLTQEQYDRIKENWDSKYQGSANAHKTAILEGGLKYMAMTQTPRDMQFTEGRKETSKEILAIFRVPKEVLGILEDSNLASAQVADLIFTKYTVKPKMRFFVDKLNEFYLPLFKLDSKKYRLAFKDPVAENVEEKRKDRESGIKNYYMTPNEARAEIGKEPIEGGDELYLPSGVVPLSQATTAAQGDTTDNGQDNGNGGKGAAKTVRVKKNGKTRKIDNPLNREFVDQEIADQHEVYLDLNAKLEEQLLKNLKNAKSVDTYLEKMARAVSKEAQDELVQLIWEDYNDWIGLVYNATKEGLKRTLEESGKQALLLLEVDAGFDVSHPRVLDWLNEHALEDSNSYSGTLKEDITLKVMEGVETGASNDKIADSIKGFFEDQSDYRAMRIARTEVINAYGAGALEGYKQSGVVAKKFWQPDNEACPTCQENADKGTIGLDEEFPSGDTEPTAHPNAILGGQEIEAGGVLAKMTAPYNGLAIEFTTASGKQVSVTPKHPMATTQGWVEADRLKEGDNLISTSPDFKGMIAALHPEGQPMKAMIEDVVVPGDVILRRVPAIPVYLNGDAASCEYIDVVFAKGKLGFSRNAPFFKLFSKRDLIGRDIGKKLLIRLRTLNQLLLSPLLTTNSVLSSLNLSLALGGSSKAVREELGFTRSSQSDAELLEASSKRDTTDGNLWGKFLQRFSGFVSPDKIVNVRYYHFSGHIYDMTTLYNIYSTNGILNHNCECSLGAMVKED